MSSQNPLIKSQTGSQFMSQVAPQARALQTPDTPDTSDAPDALPNPTEVIPHRPPFLFLTRVLKCDENSAIGEHQFAEDDPIFRGHFPGRPLVPGVLLSEGAAQLLAYWALLRRPDHWVLLTGLDRAKWSHEVRPGDQLTYHVEITRVKLGLVIAKAHVTCGEVTAMTAQIKGYLQAREPNEPTEPHNVS